MIDQIIDWGMQAAPEEACGLLVDDGGAYRICWLANDSQDPLNGYVMHPPSIGEAIGSEEEWDRTIIWHTHPGGLVGPSEADRQHLVEGLMYLVVTIPTGEYRWFGKVRDASLTG